MSSPAKTLIDNAAKMCGSEAELARRIGTSPAALSHLKHGNREMSPETAALLADIAHMDAREAVIQAIIERNKTGPKAEQIREILGKALAAGVAAVLVFSYADLPTSAMESAASELTILTTSSRNHEVGGLFLMGVAIASVLWPAPRRAAR